MPRFTQSQLRWSEQTQTYVVFIDDQASAQTLTNDWLAQIASFAFHSRFGCKFASRKISAPRVRSARVGRHRGDQPVGEDLDYESVSQQCHTRDKENWAVWKAQIHTALLLAESRQ